MAAGAAAGAAVNGVIGGLQGAAAGVRRGLGSGSRSTPAAAATMGVLGVTGLVEWPLLLVVGGGALLVRQLNRSGEAVDGPEAAAAVQPVKRAPATKVTARTAAPSHRATRSASRRSVPGKATARR